MTTKTTVSCLAEIHHSPDFSTSRLQHSLALQRDAIYFPPQCLGHQILIGKNKSQNKSIASIRNSRNLTFFDTVSY